MIDRSLRRRLAQAEKRLFPAIEKRLKMREQRKERACSLARLHAAAVAAIVLSGDPNVEEPLIRAWARTLAHYKLEPGRVRLGSIFDALEFISARFGGPVDDFEAERLEAAVQKSTFKDYLDATQRLYPIVMNGAKEERARFTEIFSAAPVWLLTYTFTWFDAGLLKF